MKTWSSYSQSTEHRHDLGSSPSHSVDGSQRGTLSATKTGRRIPCNKTLTDVRPLHLGRRTETRLKQKASRSAVGDEMSAGRRSRRSTKPLSSREEQQQQSVDEMSKLAPSLKALINAPFSRPGPCPAPARIGDVYRSIAREAAERQVGLRPWVTISVRLHMLVAH